MPGLTAIFVAHGGAPFVGAEAALQEAVGRARRARPELELDDRTFVEHLARHVRNEGDVAAALAALHVEDLYLACACMVGDDRALAVLESDVIARAMVYVRKIDRRSATILDEVIQSLRVRMLVREPTKEPAIASYGGRAPLDAWLRVAAVREARALLRRTEGSVTHDEGHRPVVGAPQRAPGLTPEHAFLKQEGLASMGASLERVLEALDERDRVLLRLYFIEGMSLANLGRVYHVHESTMARRLQALRGRIAAAVKCDLAVDTSQLESVLALAESQLDMHLSVVLRGRR